MDMKDFTAKCLRRLILGWLLAALVEALAVRPALAGVADLGKMKLLRLILITLGIAAALFFSKWQAVERWGLPVAFAALAAVSLKDNYRPSFLQGCLVIFAVLVAYAVFGWDGSQKQRDALPAKKQAAKKQEANSDTLAKVLDIACPVAVGALAVWFVWFVSAWTVGRVNIFWTPTYDFGIFSQMFYSMATHGTPVTTLERDVGALSHFAVHVSPSYYLMLPFYLLRPEPATLQVLQAVIMASSVIPLWLIGKRHGLCAPARAVLCALLLSYPAFAGGAYYDLHENCMLTPAILWLFYALDTDKPWLIALSALITLGVKEDAAVYVAVIALYALLRAALKKDGRGAVIGGTLLAVSLLWFFGATSYLASKGDGVMTYRYNNFMYDGKGSLVTVIKAVLMSPMKALYECTDPEKLEYIKLTMLPLLALPLITRRYERLVLLIPYILINLMSDYQYQHSILFQYNFGSIACLMYLVAVNVADIPWKSVGIGALACALALSMSFFTREVKPIADTVMEYDETYRGWYDGIEDTLDTVPDGASVTATTFYTTYLSQRDVIYDLGYCTRSQMLSTDYIVLNLDDNSNTAKYGGIKGLLNLLESEGYVIHARYGENLAIYRRETP